MRLLVSFTGPTATPPADRPFGKYRFTLTKAAPTQNDQPAVQMTPDTYTEFVDVNEGNYVLKLEALDVQGNLLNPAVTAPIEAKAPSTGPGGGTPYVVPEGISYEVLA